MTQCYRCDRPFLVNEHSFVGDRCTVCKEALLEICAKCLEDVKRIGVFGRTVAPQEILQNHIRDKHTSVELVE